MNVVMNTTTSRLVLSVLIMALAGCSLPDSKTASTVAQAAVREVGFVTQGLVVNHSRAEPLCPLCVQLSD